MRRGEIDANGIRFAYLEAGSGPLVLLLHGFPDNAYSWEHQLPALARAGYRAAAPFLRGRLLETQRDLLPGAYRWVLVEHAGHFLHREQPERVDELIVDWLRQASAGP